MSLTALSDNHIRVYEKFPLPMCRKANGQRELYMGSIDLTKKDQEFLTGVSEYLRYSS